MAKKKIDPPVPPISKAEAMRTARSEGVIDAKKGVEFVRERFGIEISPQLFSLHGAMERKREGEREDQRAVSPVPIRPENDALSITMDVLRPLVDRFGPSKIKDLVDMLGGPNK